MLMPQERNKEWEDNYDRTMSLIESHMAKLLTEAQTTLATLDRLGERLRAINILVNTESGKVIDMKHDLLAELWTMLGGNKKKLRRYDMHLDLLKGIDDQRKRAHAHVMIAITTIEQVSSSLEDIRERASGPALVDMPMDVQILSMRSSLERIFDWRTMSRNGRVSVIKKALD